MAGAEQKAHFQCFDLPHSDDCFVIAFPAENNEAFLEGHNQAFAYFGGVTRLWRARHKRGYVKDRIMRRSRGRTRLVLDCRDFCFT